MAELSKELKVAIRKNNTARLWIVAEDHYLRQNKHFWLLHHRKQIIVSALVDESTSKIGPLIRRLT